APRRPSRPRPLRSWSLSGSEPSRAAKLSASEAHRGRGRNPGLQRRRSAPTEQASPASFLEPLRLRTFACREALRLRGSPAQALLDLAARQPVRRTQARDLVGLRPAHDGARRQPRALEAHRTERALARLLPAFEHLP